MYSDTAIKPPRTALEAFERLPEGTLVQLIKDKLIMSPAATDIHQKVLNEINFLLLTHLKRHKIGEVRIAPYGVYLDNENVYQPDLIFIANENLDKIQKNGYHGVPDLVIEVLSPKTKKYDLGEKKQIYERYGVKEYWTVNPETKSVQGLFLKNDQYQQAIKMESKIASLLLNTDFNF